MRQQSQAFLAMGLPLRELLLIGVIGATLSTARSQEAPQGRRGKGRLMATASAGHGCEEGAIGRGSAALGAGP